MLKRVNRSEPNVTNAYKDTCTNLCKKVRENEATYGMNEINHAQGKSNKLKV